MDNRIVNYIEQTVIKDKKVPCFGIVVKRRNETLLEQYFGYSDCDREKPLTKDDLFYMYSMTKPITAVSALILVEQGRLSLETKVKDVLPEFGDVYLMVNGKKVRPETDMTVKHLLTMTAGFSYDVDTPFISKVKSDYGEKATTRQFVNAFIKSPLLFEPGSRFNYSVCHDVLGCVIETVSGKRFSDFVKENVFDPLGMSSSDFRMTDGVKEKLVSQYIFLKNRGVTVTNMKNPQRLSENYDSCGAGIISNARDYSIFADALANGGVSSNGYKLLKPETVKMLYAPILSSVSVDCGFTCVHGTDYGYGLGVRTRIRPTEYTPIGEFGWDGAAGSYVFMDCASGLSMVVCAHVLGWPPLLLDSYAELRELCFKIYG